jgi:hypothetical protein
VPVIRSTGAAFMPDPPMSMPNAVDFPAVTSQTLGPPPSECFVLTECLLLKSLHVTLGQQQTLGWESG